MKIRMFLAAAAISGALLTPADAKTRHRTTRPGTVSRKAPKVKATGRRTPNRPKIKRQKPPKATRQKAGRAS